MSKRSATTSTASAKKAKSDTLTVFDTELDDIEEDVVPTAASISTQGDVNSIGVSLWNDVCAAQTDDERSAVLNQITSVTAPLVIQAFCKQEPLSSNESFSALAEVIGHLQVNQISLESLSGSFIASAVIKTDARRLVAFLLLLNWHDYMPCCQRFQKTIATSKSITEPKRSLLSSSDAIPNNWFWACMYVVTEKDQGWARKCREHRSILNELPKSTMPPPSTVDLDLAQFPELECAEIRNHVCQLAIDCVANGNLNKVVWAWIAYFYTIVGEDHYGAIIQLAIQQKDKVKIKSIIERGGFAKFATRTMLSAIQSKLDDEKDQTGAGHLMVVSAALTAKTRGSTEPAVPLSTFSGLAGPLIRMALKGNDDEMFNNVIKEAPNLGPIVSSGDIVRTLVKENTVAKFDAYISLTTIDVAHVWRSFVIAVTATNDKHMEMFAAFLKHQKGWMMRNREHVQKTLEGQNLIAYLLEFASFCAEHTNSSKDTYRSTLDSFKRLVTKTAANNAKNAADADPRKCSICLDLPANHMLMCGHRVACGLCIENCVKTGPTERCCPYCKAKVDQSQRWYIKTFD